NDSALRAQDGIWEESDVFQSAYCVAIRSNRAGKGREVCAWTIHPSRSAEDPGQPTLHHSHSRVVKNREDHGQVALDARREFHPIHVKAKIAADGDDRTFSVRRFRPDCATNP